MSQRKTWLEEEDRVLKMLVVERGLTKWAKIAKIMAEQFQLTDRTGKQCRERYHNHLDNRIKHGPWSKQEEEALIGLQNNMGNHWAEISRVLAGRSENCVKNKFYSILRRGVKVLNLAIKNHFKKYKELEVSNTYKIVDCCEPAFGAQAPSLKCSESCDIKKRLIFYGMRDDSYPFTKEDYADIKSLIDSIRLFRKRQKSTIGPEATRLEEKGEGAESKSPEAEMKTEEGKQAPYPDLDFDFLDHPQEQIQEQQPIKKCILQSEVHGRSLQSFGLQGLEKEAEDREGRLGNGLFFEPVLSKNLSIFSNFSYIERKSSSNEAGGELILKQSTIKSFDFPQDIVRPSLVMMQSPHFDQLRGNYNSWNFHFHPQQ